jgi:hypothetical protein
MHRPEHAMILALTPKERASLEPQKSLRREERLLAIRQAVWDAWSDDERAFDRLHDVLVDALMPDSPLSRDQLKAVFMMLSAPIIGLGVAWGFNDTEVGDSMYRFIEDNAEAVLSRVASAS